MSSPPATGFYRQNFGVSTQRLRKISRQAKQFNIRVAKGQRVRLETENRTRDKHARLLAYVYLPGGEMLNRMLLEEGLATVFRRYDFGLKTDFLDSEQRARSRRLGLWRTD